ncbi:hypothetical protein GOP47_0005792 [Adiantum capillus-veneris]|uniref:Uncharacterized protein n=1 Tax=Adiantum capillus-veneris TaxID=13818 RepID=A0A9D4V6Y4_ADICA|nr:hypothetical protein GOP47_0005792 [Adiantum capillus-veneris]
MSYNSSTSSALQAPTTAEATRQKRLVNFLFRDAKSVEAVNWPETTRQLPRCKICRSRQLVRNDSSTSSLALQNLQKPSTGHCLLLTFKALPPRHVSSQSAHEGAFLYTLVGGSLMPQLMSPYPRRLLP